jgi:hypothetical protein
MVTYTDAQTGGFTLKSGQSSVNSNQCVTKAEANTKYILNTAFTDSYVANQLIPKTAWRSVPNTPVCSSRILAFQICNENSVKDDNFDIYLNNQYIGAVNLNQNAQIGSVFIASLDTNITIGTSDFPCAISGMVIYRFNPGFLLSENTLEMRNTQNNNSGNAGSIGIRNYLLTGNSLNSPCTILNLQYSGVSGLSFTKSFDYTVCCPTVTLTQGATTSTSIVLNWTTTVAGVSSFIVKQNASDTNVGNVNTYNVTGLTTNTSYDLKVQAVDSYGNLSVVSNTITYTPSPTPSSATNLVKTGSTTSSISFQWTAGADAAGYYVYLDNANVATISSTSFTASGLQTNQSYAVRVTAFNGANQAASTPTVNMSTDNVVTSYSFLTTTTSTLNIEEACDFNYNFTLYSNSSSIANGVILYSDSGLTNTFNGESRYRKIDNNGSASRCRISSGGQVSVFGSCFG